MFRHTRFDCTGAERERFLHFNSVILDVMVELACSSTSDLTRQGPIGSDFCISTAWSWTQVWCYGWTCVFKHTRFDSTGADRERCLHFNNVILDASKTKVSTNLTQVSPKMAPRWPRNCPNGFQGLQNGPKMIPGLPKMPPRWNKVAANALQIGSQIDSKSEIQGPRPDSCKPYIKW